jgi:cystathionine gamma-lyase
MKNLKLATKVIHSGSEIDAATGAVVAPIYSSSIYVQKQLKVEQQYHYSRVSNPNRDALERCVADLEGGQRGFAFGSGMAAIATVLELLEAGSHVIVTQELYGGSYRLFETVRKRTANLHFSYVDMTDVANIEKAILPNTRMIWAESPTNPLLTIIDLAKVASIARAKKIISVVDNTFATPLLQRPLAYGFDIVVHSATKYLNGHSDVLNGIVVVGDNAAIADNLKQLQIAVGAVPSPADCYAVLRGIKTLALRMERHCSNAHTLAQWLAKHPKIAKAYYPGLTSHPQHQLAKKQMAAFGGVVSVLINGGYEATKLFLESCSLFPLTASLGGVESLVAHPRTMSHSSLSDEFCQQLGIVDNLVRISVGVEDVQDLQDDLEHALARL